MRLEQAGMLFKDFLQRTSLLPCKDLWPGGELQTMVPTLLEPRRSSETCSESCGKIIVKLAAFVSGCLSMG